MPLGTAVTADPSMFRPQDAGAWKPGLAMALFVHLFLVGALAVAVHWKIKPPTAVEAEVWSEVPRVQEEPPPQPVVLPKPVPEEPPPEAKPVEKPADIAMVPVKPQKHPKKEPKEVFLPDPPKKAPPKAEVKPKPVEKTPPKVVPPPPPAKPLVDPKAEAKAKAAADAKAKADKEIMAAQRRANLDKLMRDLAQDSSGPSDAYRGRIMARLKSNIAYPRIDGNPGVVVTVKCAPDGKITGRDIVIGSGDSYWDQAVLRAIDKTQVLPLDENKRVHCPMELVWNAQD